MCRIELKFCLFLSLMVSCHSANILYLISYIGKSQYIMLKPIGLELAKRGHNVTVITVFSENNPPPNYHQVLVDDKIWNAMGGKRPSHFSSVDLSAEERHNRFLWTGGLTLTEVVLNSTQVQRFLAADHKFDVVISEQFFQEAMYILAHKYEAPLVLITSYGNCMRHNIATRNPLQLATVISEFLVVQQPGSFYGRLRNLYFTVYEYVWWRFWYLRKMDRLATTYVPNLKEPVPSLYEIQKNVSLFLINSHFSFDPPTAYFPNIVEVGGVHLPSKVPELPQDLQKILDEATNGVVYMTFGSNIKSSMLPVEKKNAFLNVFRRLKLTVLWKWEDDQLQNKPDNVVIREWLPQNEILAHPNVKVFISHGGLIGTQEAIYHGVPIIGIPIYGDQFNNLLQIQEAGFGKLLQFHEITEETLDKMLNEVLNNESYSNKAKEVSQRFRDRPMTPLDTAVYWIEYVIRNKGASYMKNSGLKMSWIAYNMLDVYAFVLLVILSTVYCTLKILRVLRHFLQPKVDKKSSKIKKS
nr:uridine diphosphate-glycosyltransferases 39B20 [Glyphodes pyloalis]